MSFDINSIDKQAGIVSKTIKGSKYTLQLLPASTGLSMALELGKLLMPSVGAGIDGFRHDEIIHGAPKTFAELMQLFVKQMGDVRIVPMVQALLQSAEVDGKPLDFDTHFRGNYGSMVQLVELALVENFESFFTESGLKTRMQELMANLMAQAPEQPESSES